jgi:hypothetical protein
MKVGGMWERLQLIGTGNKDHICLNVVLQDLFTVDHLP